jgi:hypothetical protein
MKKMYRNFAKWNFFFILNSKAVTLKERIDRIINTPEIELGGEAYRGKYELGNVASIKRFILTKLRLNNEKKNNVYTNKDTGNKIILSDNSAGKLASQYKYGETYQKTLSHIPQIIENMKFLEKMLPDKEKSHFDGYSYYVTGVKIDGIQHTVFSTVGYAGKEIYYDQNLFNGTPQEVFNKAKNSTESKYSRLSKILEKAEDGG